MVTDEVDPDNTNEKLNLHKLFKKLKDCHWWAPIFFCKCGGNLRHITVYTDQSSSDEGIYLAVEENITYLCFS